MGRRGIGDETSRGQAAALAVLVALLTGLQVSWAQEHHCFRIDALRLLANLIEAIKPSEQHGTHTPTPSISLQKLKFWLQMLPDTTRNTVDVNRTLEAVVGKVKIAINKERKVLEVADFPANLEIIPKDSHFSRRKKISTSLTEFNVKEETILQGLDFVPDKSDDPSMVRVAVNPWSSKVDSGLNQISIILSTHRKAVCEIDVPRSVEEASKLLQSISNMEENFHVEEISIINSASVASMKKKNSMPPKCETLLGVEPRSEMSKSEQKVHISESMKIMSWVVSNSTVRVGPQLASMLHKSPRKSTQRSSGKPKQLHPPVVEIRACLPADILTASHIPQVWKQIITKVLSSLISERNCNRSPHSVKTGDVD